MKKKNAFQSFNKGSLNCAVSKYIVVPKISQALYFG